MKRKRSSEVSIIAILKKYEARRLRDLQAENRKLKRILAEPDLDKAAFR